MSKHDFCRQLLKQVRAEARAAGISVPKGLHVWRSSAFRNYAQVFDEHGTMLWEGDAHCAYEARAKYISGLIDDHQAKEP